MVFSSLLFMFIFLPLTLLLYYICPAGKNFCIKNALLFFVSLVFYAWGEPVYVVLMILTTVTNFTAALLIDKYRQRKKLILVFSVIANLGVLMFFKYTDFFITLINSVASAELPMLNLPLPIGISFYTFQTMSYTIDVYRNDAPVQKNILSFGAYVALFPQLIAGPIVRYKTIADQLSFRTHSVDKFAAGVVRFSQGFAKKVLLANNLGVIWQNVTAMPWQNMSVLTSWLGICAFALQIYFDFSGYSDMAIGLGRMFGFEFLENFNYPYISASITEFWRRWHISLGTWFREYVYIPLGGNRRGSARTYINLFIVWFLTGFWHGAGYGYIIWGVYFGALIIIEKAFLLKFLNHLPKFICHIYLIFTVLISWVFFAIEDFNKMTAYLSTMFGGAELYNSRFLYLLQTNAVLLIIAIICSTPLLKKAMRFSPVRRLTAIACIAIWLLGTAFLVADSYNPFLYFRF